MTELKLLGQLNGQKILAILAFALSFALPNMPSARAADTHVFDPVHSLTGDCTTSSLDPVADPGCPDPPHPGSFAKPRSVATDFYGNIYVATIGKSSGGSEGRIDVFDPTGVFITQVPDPAGPMALAIDSKGTLYVSNLAAGKRIYRYSPSLYSPETGEIEYANPPVIIEEKGSSPVVALGLNIANDHLFANFGTRIVEYGSAAEESKVLKEPVGEVFNPSGYGLAIDAAHGRIYATHSGNVIRVLALTSPHALLDTIEGSAVPGGKFAGPLSVAADEGTGHVFIFDQEANRVYELTESGEYVSTIEHGFQFISGSQLGVDNGPFSPNGAVNDFGRYLFVPSHPSGVGHSFAFGPAEECPPAVESFSFTGVTENEVEFLATIDPCNLDTTYAFEITTQESYELEGFAGASTLVGGQLPAGKGGAPVSAAAAGLFPGVDYRFRVVATNEEGSDEEEGRFRTYPLNPISPCPNDAVRTGPSSSLPDCRAYELVTPADTNARSPRIGQLGTYFTTRTSSPAGDEVSFQIEGGSIPGAYATGSLAGDPYVARRGAAGWSTRYTGPTAAESPELLPGSTSPDQNYSFWSTAGGRGSAAVEGDETSYVRYPDGHSELVGRGSLGTDPRAVGRLISEDGGHIVFDTGSNGSTPQQLEPNAPPDGTRAIYDRTIDPITGEEETRVISLLPHDSPPGAGETAVYQGASLDGKGIAFRIGAALYLRFDNEETFEIGDGTTFAGISEGGGRIFYVEEGDLKAFEVGTGTVIEFTETGDVIPVNVSADGTAAYFVSQEAIPTDPNPLGDTPEASKENLYLSKEGQIGFVGTVTERDVEGEFEGVERIDGLGLWIEAVGPSVAPPGSLAKDPSRTNPDGSVLLFQSRAGLTGYDPEGHTQVYRYDSIGGTLQCLSCNPTGVAADGEATLQSLGLALGDPEPLTSYVPVPNLRSDGRRAFFQSTEALVPGDTDELQDVYEWEDQDLGSCKREDGCVHLISSGHSNRNDYLYGVSDSGDDVFFTTADMLLSSDSAETPSIYDARVGGGFPIPRSEGCEGEACHLPLPLPPSLVTSQTFPTESGKPPRRRCRKGLRKVRRHGKVRCVKKHHRQRSSSQKRAAK
ncbi:MAG TPA: hypothetical protein VFM51_12170 [Solirubrobacterales bacterium]|nr:hypothetical protein [Solirubrobacterales bacterium]